MEVGDVADITEVHVVSIFGVNPHFTSTNLKAA
jgi:hypothetical protein